MPGAVLRRCVIIGQWLHERALCAGTRMRPQGGIIGRWVNGWPLFVRTIIFGIASLVDTADRVTALFLNSTILLETSMSP